MPLDHAAKFKATAMKLKEALSAQGARPSHHIVDVPPETEALVTTHEQPQGNRNRQSSHVKGLNPPTGEQRARKYQMILNGLIIGGISIIGTASFAAILIF